MTYDPKQISEEDAVRLWKRAAELQADAARRAEIGPGPVGDTDSDGDAESEDTTAGYALEHVRAAAIEAGIGEEYLEAALVEMGTQSELPGPPGGISDALALRFLNDPADFLEVSRVVEASLEEVVAAMEKLFPNPPYNLVLKDRRGRLGAGGVLVFDIDGASFVTTEGWAGQASWADMREIYVSARPIEGAQPACELTLRSPIAWARPLNFWIGAGLTTVPAVMGVGVGTALAAATAGILAAMATIAAILGTLFVVAGVTAGTAAGVAGFRALYRSGLTKGEKALTALLGAVAIEAQGGWGIDAMEGPEPVSYLPPPDEVDD